ncbi:MAG: hypothetical protein K2G94_03230 [Muribaculaceae bacterium]|nr:hypothetical protein [Muribaculaceae bacterium]MDE6462110.1 hypothetical protein [Muribaculaceae bacterium]
MNTFRSLTLAAMATMTLGAHAKDKINEQTYNNIVNYFESYITDRTDAPYKVSTKLKVADLAEARAEVWQAWVKANEADTILPELRPLALRDSLSWTLPDSLEPNAVMDYFYGFKGDTATVGKLPLFLYLHGSGPRDAEWDTGFRLAEMFDDSPSVYVVPRIPNEGEYYRWYQKSKQWAWERLFRSALASGKIDPNRIYLFGISEGGYGSQRLASFYADYLAGAGPMAGGEPLKNAPVENLRNVAFSLRTGADDHGFYRDLLTSYTKHALDSVAVENPGYYIHEVELIPGRGHHIDYRVTTPWLKQFSRQPHATRLTWENFEMDGRYRDGFGNLYVMERSNPNDSTRTLYDMTIAGNTIRLNVQLVTYTTTQTDPHWGIQLKFNKSYTRATEGRVKIYLDEQMVDLTKPVTLIINGHEVFYGRVDLNVENMVNSCAEFFDPERIFPAALDVYL